MASDPKSKSIECSGSQKTIKKTKGKRTEDTPKDSGKVSQLKNELKKAKGDNAELQVESRMCKTRLATV